MAEQFFVIDAEANRYGPADLAEIRHWKSECRVAENTLVESAATGNQYRASELEGLFGRRTAPPQVRPPAEFDFGMYSRRLMGGSNATVKALVGVGLLGTLALMQPPTAPIYINALVPIGLVAANWRALSQLSRSDLQLKSLEERHGNAGEACRELRRAVNLLASLWFAVSLASLGLINRILDYVATGSRGYGSLIGNGDIGYQLMVPLMLLLLPIAVGCSAITFLVAISGHQLARARLPSDGQSAQ